MNGHIPRGVGSETNWRYKIIRLRDFIKKFKDGGAISIKVATAAKLFRETHRSWHSQGDL